MTWRRKWQRGWRGRYEALHVAAVLAALPEASPRNSGARRQEPRTPQLGPEPSVPSFQETRRQETTLIGTLGSSLPSARHGRLGGDCLVLDWDACGVRLAAGNWIVRLDSNRLMGLTIAILEDNAERREAMERLLAVHFPTHSRQYFTSSSAMMDRLRVSPSGVIFTSLDHDLELFPGEDGRCVDCGTGREVADFLATQSARCPIVIHSTNYPAAVGIEILLVESGWPFEKTAP
jgi:hypothetical protein